ncbi:MAG: molybdate ABC transporter permease subunit [Desulfomicrobium sp.]|jgi:molybdate transport system permease protein|nr:molybdate ABC transporter permease subunit [Desulfomicrobium sp.]
MDTNFFFPIQLSLRVASLATLVSLVLGLFLGWIFHRHRFPGKELLDSILSLPLVLPPTVLGYYLIVLLGRKGLVGRWLEDSFGVTLMFSWQGAVIAAAVVSFPLIFKSVRAALDGVERKYEDAARTMGYPEWRVFLRVSLPLAGRGILAGAMLAFARAMGEFGATLMIAGNLPGRTQTLSLAVYSATQAGNDSLASQLVLLISILCTLILWISGKLLTPKWQA